jgi:predicted permease
MLFGLLPAVRVSDVDPMTWLKHRSAGGANPKLILGRLLLALQIGVSVPLVVGAALFLRTISNLGSEDLGFDPENMAMFYVDPTYTRLPEDQHVRLFTEIMEGVREIPGVTSVTLMRHTFLSGVISNNRFDWNGRDVDLLFNYVGPDFARTTGMRVLAGRMPGIQDGPESNTVGVLNETAVGVLFGGAAPLGEVVTLNNRDVEIIGVVNDGVYDRQRRDVAPTLYYSALQGNVSWGRYVVLRSTVPVGRLEAPLREALARVDGDLPVPEIRTQMAQIADSNSRERIFTQLLTLFGGFALLLASIGLHGVTSYTVSRRTSEFGVRVALGARPGDVQWLVLRQVLMLAVAGLFVGIPASLAAGPLVSSLLYEVAPNDLRMIVAASLVMLAVAVAAGFRPARRAARMPALTALREE